MASKKMKNKFEVSHWLLMVACNSAMVADFDDNNNIYNIW